MNNFHTPILKQKTIDAGIKPVCIVLSAPKCQTHLHRPYCINVHNAGVIRFFKAILRIFQDDLEGYFVFIRLPGHLGTSVCGEVFNDRFLHKANKFYVSEVESNWPRSWPKAEI